MCATIHVWRAEDRVAELVLFYVLFCFVLFLETGFLCVALAVPELAL